MSVQQTAIRIVTFPFRALWFLILSVNFLVVSAACVLFAAFVAYALALTISYLLFPAEWTRALWEWAASLYAQSPWFKGATITFFVLLLLPIVKLWPGRDLKADAAREREATRINDDLIAARHRAHAQRNFEAEGSMTGKPLSLAISTFKGGAGKSTLNVNLAAEFAQQGHRTLLIDCDEQESSTRWYNVSMKRGLLPTDGTLLHLRVAPDDRFADRLAEAPAADIRIYDVGGYVHQRAIEVYHECDAVLIPVIPEPTAATSAIKVATILKEISRKRAQGPIPYAAIWSYVDMIALRHNRSLPEVHVILTSGQIPMVDTVIRKSNHFSDVGAGFGSLYSKLANIENNPALTPSAKRRASESVLDAIDLVKKINNEFIGLLQAEAA